jgi:hypothetical protein
VTSGVSIHIASIASNQQIAPGNPEYKKFYNQYATTSYMNDNRMSPALLIQPHSKEDIAAALKYAKDQKIAVAVRTGGHQYCGASSTLAPNIQLDLRSSFKETPVISHSPDGKKTFVHTGVSWGLGDFNAWLGKHQVFVPHGQCTNVHLGGHVQTGGYGQLGRSFGLFGDHVVSLEIVEHNGDFKTVTRSSDPELFHALLGGSPGNLGVITHFTIEVYRDQDYDRSRGLKALYFYNKETLKRLLTLLAKMSDDLDFPRNYDFCISVLSSDFDLPFLFPEADSDDFQAETFPKVFGTDGITRIWPRMIVVYAQWVPFGPNDHPDDSWFKSIAEGSVLPHVKVRPMSQLTSDWIFRNIREFNLPYVKSTYLTNSTTLVKDNWPEWLTNRIDDIVAPDLNGCHISAQIQNFGGKHSKFTTNADNGTAYSWRKDSTICCTLDIFYKGPEALTTATEWHNRNEAEGIGAKGIFCKEDRRVLWGSFGDFDLHFVWKKYFESAEKYERLMAARKKADPYGVLTPNSFCVKGVDL